MYDSHKDEIFLCCFVQQTPGFDRYLIFIILEIQVIHDTTPNQSFQIGKSTIHVSSPDIEDERKSYSFQGFQTMNCILNEELNWYSIILKLFDNSYNYLTPFEDLFSTNQLNLF